MIWNELEWNGMGWDEVEGNVAGKHNPQEKYIGSYNGFSRGP